MNYNEKAKIFAKELTMERIRESNKLDKCGNTQDIVDDIAKIFEEYYNAILNNGKLKDLL